MTADLLSDLNFLTKFHRERCQVYRDYVDSLFGDSEPTSFYELPYLPVTAFKGRELRSVAEEEIYRRMYSSGTGSRGKSTIVVDRETAKLQTKALASSFKDYFGAERRPMLVIDGDLKDHSFSARRAGISGFSTFSKKIFYALDSRGRPDWDGIERFLSEPAPSGVMVFGFTFVVWKFLQEMMASNIRFSIPNSFLLHGGGWKKLTEEAVSRKVFSSTITENLGISSVHNYYGMIEQTGSIYFECELGSLHAPAGGGFLIRHPLTLEPVSSGTEGVVQVFSSIQKSYPGHSLLTEDIGYATEGNCPCGREGERLNVVGRLSNSEIRGCSDAV